MIFSFLANQLNRWKGKPGAGFNVFELQVATSDGRNFRLLGSFSFTRPNGEVIVVPVGALSDGASTPRELWSVIPPFGKYWLAAYLHDFLYRCTLRPRAECDAIFLEAMESLGVSQIEREAIFDGVRAGGAHAFNQDRLGK